MCGLYGYVSRDPKEITVNTLRLLAIKSESRGKHATGYSAISNSGIYSHKAPVRASQFNFNRLYYQTPHIVIAHNRAATHGNPENNQNNHPFTSKRFAFAHNGNLNNQGIEIKTHSECDSERMFRLFLKKFSTVHNITKALELTGKYFINQAFACSLLDRQTQQVYLFRNSKRPLAVAKTKNSIYWASTRQILEQVFSGKDVNIFELCKHKIYTIDRNSLEITNSVMCWSEQVLDSQNYYKANSIENWYQEMQQTFGGIR